MLFVNGIIDFGNIINNYQHIKKPAVARFIVSNLAFAGFDFDGSKKTEPISIKLLADDVETPKVNISKDETTSVNVKEWTIMVFLNAKNNLESYGLKDVNEMEMVGSSDKVNIVVEFGRIKGYSTDDGDWTGCRRYYITKDNDTKKINSPIIEERAKCDMGSWEYLVDFAKWSMTKYPAKKYVLIVWNHGSGWDKGSDISQLLIDKGISYDDETRNHITTPQLRMAMEKIGKVDIFAMDACLMQMVEVGYEIKDYASYIVASEETEPADGYTYNTWLEPLIKEPTMDAKKLSVAMVNSYTDHYQSIGQGATHSSLALTKMEKLKNVVDAFIDAVIGSNDIANAKNARTNAQKFYYSSNKDLYHFVKLMVDATQVPEVKAKGSQLLNFMKDELIIHNRAYGSRYANAYGIAVWVPTYYSTSYDELIWAKDSKWDEFIKWLSENKSFSPIGQVIVGGCIEWAVEKICDLVWNEIKKVYEESCKERKI
ncbi:MAG: clostripain-related cysteine peptidase, partial [Candidatus Anstonellales archaeon]